MEAIVLSRKRQEMRRAQKIINIRYEFSKPQNKAYFTPGHTLHC